MFNRFCLIVLFAIMNVTSLFAAEASQEGEEAGSREDKLFVRCYERCGVTTDVPLSQENPTWNDLKEALCLNKSNITAPLKLMFGKEEIQYPGERIPQKYFNTTDPVDPTIYYEFGDVFAEFLTQHIVNDDDRDDQNGGTNSRAIVPQQPVLKSSAYLPRNFMPQLFGKSKK